MIFSKWKVSKESKLCIIITYFGITLYCIQYSFLYLALRIFVYSPFLNHHLTFIFYFYHKWLLSDIILEWNTVFMCFVQELESHFLSLNYQFIAPTSIRLVIYSIERRIAPKILIVIIMPFM